MAERICRLCSNRPATSKEHIVLNSLGGKQTVNGLVCDTCNNERGKDIDAPLEESVRTFSILLRCMRGDGRPVAPLRGVTARNGGKVDLLHGGRPSKHRKPTVKKDENAEKTELAIEANSTEEAAYLLAHQMRRFGVTPENLDTERFESHSAPAGWLQLSFPFPTAQLARSVAKSGLAALAKTCGCEVVDIAALDAVAAFVHDGSNDERRFYLPVASRRAFQEALSVQRGTHVLCVYDSQDGAFTVLVLFGFIPIWVRLADEKLGLDKPIIHVVDPRLQTHENARRELGPLPAFAPTELDPTEIRKMFAELMEFCDQVQNEMWIEFAADEAARPIRDLPDGTTITQDHVDKVLEAFTPIIEQRMLGTTRVEQLDKDELMAQAMAVRDKLGTKK